MMVKVFESTDKYPLQKIGKMCGVCWNSPVDDADKNIERAKECIRSGHGRVLEFVDVEMCLSGVSARMVREWYTHIGGSPTRLQQSTRYCEWKYDTAIVLPESVRKVISENKGAYASWYHSFIDWIDYLKYKGVPKEDIAMFYPLGMETKIVDKRNLRNLVAMFHQRACTRAYWEYRDVMKEIREQLSGISEEWKWIADNYFIPKCEHFGFCTESKGCGKMLGRERK